MEMILDPLFRLPLGAGLLPALLLPLLGVLLRLQEEWLAALGLACLAAATGVAGLAAGMPLILGAPVGALAGALIQHLWTHRGSIVSGFMILIGWTAASLVATNTVPGTGMGPGVLEGRILLVGPPDLAGLGLAALVTAPALAWLLPRLVHARLFPCTDCANARPVRRWRLWFEVITALQIAAAALTLGVMGTFALTLIPPWVAFRISPSWRGALILSVTLGGLAYIAAFWLALRLEQPFGPVLTSILILAAGISTLIRPPQA